MSSSILPNNIQFNLINVFMKTYTYILSTYYFLFLITSIDDIFSFFFFNSILHVSSFFIFLWKQNLSLSLQTFTHPWREYITAGTTRIEWACTITGSSSANRKRASREHVSPHMQYALGPLSSRQVVETSSVTACVLCYTRV